jgi:hypothetical protein
MSLPASGIISLGDIRTELGINSGLISLNDANVRALLGKSTGLISLNDSHGKSLVSNYSENINITTVVVGSSSAFTVTGGKPNGTFTIVNTGVFADGSPTTMGPFTLNASGSYTGNAIFVTNANQPVANSFAYSFKFSFNYGDTAQTTTHDKLSTITATRTVYTETVTLTPTTFAVGTEVTLAYAGGLPNGTAHVVNSEGVTVGTDVTLDANGSYSQQIILVQSSAQTVASLVYNWTVSFSTGHTKPLVFTATKVLPTYNEVVAFAPNPILVGATSTLSISGGKPNGEFTMTKTATNAVELAGALNASGGYSESRVWVGSQVDSSVSNVYSLAFDTGHTKTASLTTNKPTVYNETIAMSPTTFAAGTMGTLSITNGKPNGLVTITEIGTNTQWPPIQLNASGSYTETKIWVIASSQIEPTVTFMFRANFDTGNVRNYQFTSTKVYNEVVTVTPNPVVAGNLTTVNITGAVPGTAFTYISSDAPSVVVAAADQIISPEGTWSKTENWRPAETQYTASSSPSTTITFQNGHTRTITLTSTKVFNEIVTITPAEVVRGNPYTLAISGAEANSTFTITRLDGPNAGTIETNPDYFVNATGVRNYVIPTVNENQSTLRQLETFKLTFLNGHTRNVAYTGIRDASTFNEILTLSAGSNVGVFDPTQSVIRITVNEGTPVLIKMINGVGNGTFKVFNAQVNANGVDIPLDSTGHYESSQVWENLSGVGPGTWPFYYTLIFNDTQHTRNFNINIIKV